MWHNSFLCSAAYSDPYRASLKRTFKKIHDLGRPALPFPTQAPIPSTCTERWTARTLTEGKMKMDISCLTSGSSVPSVLAVSAQLWARIHYEASSPIRTTV